jgi:imidazolonepropionase-like amidohydrolase
MHRAWALDRFAPVSRFNLALAALAATLAVTAPAAAQPAAAPAAPAKATGEVRYVYVTQGNRSGSGTSRDGEGGERIFTFEFNDRGRGPQTEERIRVDERGLPVTMRITGHDYWKAPSDESFDLAAGKAKWKNPNESKEQEVTAPVFYLSLNGAPQELEVLAQAALRQPDGRLGLLPAGQAQVTKMRSQIAKSTASPAKSETIDLYQITGLGFSPGYFWLDADRRLFASVQGWSTLIREGFEANVPELKKIEDEVTSARQKELAAKLAFRPSGALAVTHARLFDPATGKLTPGTTVVVAGNHIQAVGADGSVAIPAGASTIDAQGKVMLPGMWDMHAHVGVLDGMLNLAAGVTTVRDMANDTDFLLATRKSWDSGEEIGTRILMAGFMDGPGPYAGPTKVLVDTPQKALAAVDNYYKLGYVQIKLYSSLDPKLVAPVVEKAHRLGMRVSGHIPNGMRAEDAVKAGFDEIQHVNFLFLNFLPKTIDTRTPARFTEVAKNAAGFDLKSPQAEAFFTLLKEHKTVSDPTLTAFEDLFSTRAGELSRTFGPVADRFPPQVQRGVYGGGLNPSAEDAPRYRQSFQRCLEMVKALYDHGIRIVAGTDNLAGFSYHHELELYAQAGIPNAAVLRIATLGAAEIMHRDQELGSVTPGKLADFILVDGDPTTKMGDIRRVTLTVKDGVVFDPAALYAELGVKPAV